MGDETVQSNWWWGIAIPAVVDEVGTLNGWFVSSSIGSGSITPIEIIVPVAVGFTALILTPVAALSLFMDSRCIRQSDTDWNPNPFLWGALGLVTLGIKIFTATTILALIAGLYLVRRYTQIGLSSS